MDTAVSNGGVPTPRAETTMDTLTAGNVLPPPLFHRSSNGSGVLRDTQTLTGSSTNCK